MINKIYGDGYGEKLVNRVGFWNAYDQETSDILGDAMEKGCDSIVFGDFFVIFNDNQIEILDTEEKSIS